MTRTTRPSRERLAYTSASHRAQKAFFEIARLDLLHPVYRLLCAALLDTEEWGQPVMLDLLVRYAHLAPLLVMRRH